MNESKIECKILYFIIEMVVYECEGRRYERAGAIIIGYGC